jgi:hypothetical protein
VLWSDESSFGIGKNLRHIRVWQKQNKRYAWDCIFPTFRGGRTSAMVWGAFTGFDKCPLVIMPQDKRTSIKFLTIVYEPTLSGFYFYMITISN